MDISYVQCNSNPRFMKPSCVRRKDQEVKSEVKDEDENTAKKEEDIDDDDEDEDAPLVQDADVRDVRYQFEILDWLFGSVLSPLLYL